MRLYRSQIPRLAEDIIDSLVLDGEIVVLAFQKRPGHFGELPVVVDVEHANLAVHVPCYTNSRK